MTCLPETPDIIATLRPDLLRLARRLADGEDQAQDLVQDTLLRLWRRRDKIAAVEDLRAYARAALRNQYRQYLRTRMPVSAEGEFDIAFDGDVFARLALNDIREAIARLPEEQSALLVLVMMGETSPQALARMMNLPEGTVMSRLARARAELRREMAMQPDDKVSSLL